MTNAELAVKSQDIQTQIVEEPINGQFHLPSVCLARNYANHRIETAKPAISSAGIHMINEAIDDSALDCHRAINCGGCAVRNTVLNKIDDAHWR